MHDSLLDHEDAHVQARQKLQLFVSPICTDPDHQDADGLEPTSRLPSLKDGADPLDDKTIPQFRRHEEPSLLEVFYDLVFAASNGIFQTATNGETFKAYIGYFSLLWATWFSVTLYDVRYVADSLFERITRATQLGVLVGFAVTAPRFDPEKQHDKHVLNTMKTMSLILCFSRLCLAVEYLGILYHARRFRRAHIPLIGQTCVNLITSAIFLGISFRFEAGRQSHVFYAWYILSAFEAISTLVLSNFSRVLGFTRTHLMKRMSLLTVIIIGDGIIAVAQDVVTIVKTADAWNAQIIGIVTAATATIYFVFLVYHDWMHHPYLPAVRQQIWTILHYPFHLSLILFMQGFTQLIIWTKAMSLFVNLTDQWLVDRLSEADNSSHTMTTQMMVDSLKRSTKAFFATYPPKYYDTWNTVNAAIQNISTLPQEIWQPLITADMTENLDAIPKDLQEPVQDFYQALFAIIYSMINSCFQALGIDIASEVRKKHPDKSSSTKTDTFQVAVTDKTMQRYRLVFAYTYIAAGSALFFLTILSIISRTTPWKKWPIARTALNLALAIGMGCTATLYFNEERALEFLLRAWDLPAITFVWLIVSITTHVRGGMMAKFRRGKAFVKDRRGKYQQRGDYAAVSVPMTPWKGPYGDVVAKDGAATSSNASYTATPGSDSLSRVANRFSSSHTGLPHAQTEHAYSVSHGYSYAGSVDYGHPQQSHSHLGQPVPYDPLQSSTEYRGALG